MSKKRDKIPPEQAERLKAMAQVVRGDPAEEEARIRAHERLRLEERDAHAARAAKREEDREAAIAQIKAANEQRMAEIRAETDAKRLELMREHARGLQELRAQKEREWDARQQEWDARRAQMQQRLQAMMRGGN